MTAAVAQQRPLLPHQGLDQADQRHFAIEHRIANGDRRLAGEYLDHFDVRNIKKFRVAALIRQDAHAALIVA